MLSRCVSSTNKERNGVLLLLATRIPDLDRGTWAKLEQGLTFVNIIFHTGHLNLNHYTVLYLEVLVLLEALLNSVNPKLPISLKSL